MLMKAEATPSVIAFHVTTAGEVVTSTPEGLAAFQASESAKWGRIIRAARIEAE